MMHTTIVTQADYEIAELESMILETKWSNNETIRLFEHEMKSLLAEDGTSNVPSESSTALNLRWMRTHLHSVGNKLDQLNTEILKWKQVQVGLATATAETSRVEKLYLEEKERGTNLETSHGQSIIMQQANEASIQNLKTKFKLLQKDLKKAQHHSSERDARLQKLNEKYRTLTELQQKRGVDDADTVSTEVVAKESKVIMENKVQSTGRKTTKSGDGALPHAALEVTKRKRPLVNISEPHALDTMRGVCTSPVSRKVAKCGEHTDRSNASSKLAPCLPLGCKTTTSVKVNHSQSLTDQPKFHRKTPIPIKAPASSVASEKRMIAKAVLPESYRGHNLVGRHIRKKFFGHGTHLGKITKFVSPYYTILYDDGDTEEMLESEIDKFLTQPQTRNSV